jgi:hypothetical protein
LRLPSNQRPYYTASMVEDIIKARETGVGVNGEFVIFYERQPKTESKQGAVNSQMHQGRFWRGPPEEFDSRAVVGVGC